eukprot:381839-Pleurochrysis_carterae.AAC.1
MQKYGQLDGVYGYSLSGHKIADLARRGVLEGVGEVQVLSPLLGRADVARGVPRQVQIARTVEDFTSGTGVALGLQNGGIAHEQVTT